MNTDDPVIADADVVPPAQAASEPDIVSDLPEAPASAPIGLDLSGVDADAFAAKIRAEYAEIAGVAAQAGRLGVTIDAADAMRQGLKPDALRRSVLDALAARSEAADVVAAAPAPATAGESPIVKRARERAAAA